MDNAQLRATEAVCDMGHDVHRSGKPGAVGPIGPE